MIRSVFRLISLQCFLTVFVEPGTAPPVHAKVSGAKLLCSTSRILYWYFNVLTSHDICRCQISLKTGFSMGG